MEKEEQKLYDVVRYFDDYKSAKVQTGLTIDEAKKLRNELTDKNHRPYTYYEVRPSLVKITNVDCADDYRWPDCI